VGGANRHGYPECIRKQCGATSEAGRLSRSSIRGDHGAVTHQAQTVGDRETRGRRWRAGQKILPEPAQKSDRKENTSQPQLCSMPAVRPLTRIALSDRFLPLLSRSPRHSEPSRCGSPRSAEQVLVWYLRRRCKFASDVKARPRERVLVVVSPTGRICYTTLLPALDG
jgi:hypothetical protein